MAESRYRPLVAAPLSPGRAVSFLGPLRAGQVPGRTVEAPRGAEPNLLFLQANCCDGRVTGHGK